MKVTVAVMGDTHNQFQIINKLKDYMKDVDVIIHTGDHYDDINYIKKIYNKKVIGVKGNCDWNGSDVLIEEINGKIFFICHGHQYNVKSNLNGIFYKGKEANADIVIFGHTHIPYYAVEEDMTLLNPGSLAFPRAGSDKSFAILQVDTLIKVKLIAL
ncbi:YfcE family phosphodiesterase [Alkaliphilus peptidifermentans]|uniref:Phosphoesterase n=1 Tax=Alkaliphilus peptidifermentans DSM 18978 TaxID=1120976 RepID=A0A1G5L557_9FIRM|nr:metallophosphoesterase [Alkaliphilus peptidifermentans]SCZ08012.1 hypothetical protein SAMN03080606_04083 [Alkaliphilus peptidifermentans DSM 18978]